MKTNILLTFMLLMALPLLGKKSFLHSGSPNNEFALMVRGGWESVLLNGDTSEIRFCQVKNQEAMYDTLTKIRESGYRGIANKTVVVYYYPESPDSYTYRATYFHDFSGKMENYGFVRTSKSLYTAGEYSWKSDTSVWIRMINARTKDSVAVTVFGNTRYKNDRPVKSSGIMKFRVE